VILKVIMMIFICEMFKYLCTFQLLSGTRRERGYCFRCSFKREATGAELTFHHSIIGNFMMNMIYGS